MTERVTGLIFDNAEIGDSLDKLIASLHKKHKVNEICKIEIRSANVYPNQIDAKYEVLIEFASKVDWSKVPIDTKVMVKLNSENNWNKRYYAGIIGGVPRTFDFGCTSWSAEPRMVAGWDEIKLADDTE